MQHTHSLTSINVNKCMLYKLHLVFGFSKKKNEKGTEKGSSLYFITVCINVRLLVHLFVVAVVVYACICVCVCVYKLFLKSKKKKKTRPLT